MENFFLYIFWHVFEHYFYNFDVVIFSYYYFTNTSLKWRNIKLSLSLARHSNKINVVSKQRIKK